MLNVLAIALGGALGAVSRYAMSQGIHAWLGKEFPWGTASVNLLGSFLMGFLLVWFTLKVGVAEPIRNALLIGFLGAFTTYSTFAADKLSLIQNGEWLKMGSYFLLTALGALLAVMLGAWVAKQCI